MDGKEQLKQVSKRLTEINDLQEKLKKEKMLLIQKFVLISKRCKND